MNDAARTDRIWLDKAFAAKCGVAPVTLRNWRSRGILIDRHRRKRAVLKAKRTGGRWYTTQEWYDDFNNTINGD